MIIERGHRIRHFSNWATRPPPADFPMASASKWPSDREAIEKQIANQSIKQGIISRTKQREPDRKPNRESEKSRTHRESNRKVENPSRTMKNLSASWVKSFQWKTIASRQFGHYCHISRTIDFELSCRIGPVGKPRLLAGKLFSRGFWTKTFDQTL